MTTCRSTSWSRGRSRSTRRGARARTAPGSAPRWRSTRSWSSPTRPGRWPTARSAAWSGGHVSDYFVRLIEALGDALGFKSSTPWEKLPAKAQKALLYGYDQQVHVRYKNRYGRERSYYTNFEGAIPYIERRHAEADSDYSRERFAGFMREVPCPSCHGARLKPVSLAVTVDGRSIADYCALPIGELAKLLLDAGAVRPGHADRGPHSQGGQRAARLPARRRPRLPHARPGVGHAGRRRGAADQAGHADRLGSGRRAVRPGRAVDRAASAGQPPAAGDPAAAARPRQHADRRRARRGHHPRGRLGRGHRAAGGRARRPRRGLRPA